MESKYPPLWQHQVEALRRIKEGKPLAIFAEIGTGKTRIMCEALKWHISEGRRQALIFAPPVVLDNWKREILKYTDIPEQWITVLYGTTKKREKALIEIQQEIQKKKDTPFILITNYESINLPVVFAKLLYVPLDVLVCDECFVPGTMVETDEGSKRIENIKPGDYVIGCFGPQRVLSTFKRFKAATVFVSFNGKTIECSENHPWLTNKGWVLAKNLKEGTLLAKTKTTMHLVQNKATQEEAQSTLLTKLCLEMEMGKSAKDETSHNQSQQRKAKFCSEHLYVFKEPNAESQHKEEGFNYFKEDETQTKGSRRQWTRPYEAREDFTEKDKTENGMELSDKNKNERLSNLLQGRPCVPVKKGSDRGRRLFPSSDSSKETRQKEREVSNWFRVDGIEIQECRSFGRPRYRDFYDLEVDKHPAFSVNEALVHNSHVLKDHQSKRSKGVFQISKNVKYKYILTGTPVLNTPMDLFAQYRILFGQFPVINLEGEISLDRGCDNFYHFRSRYFYDKNAGMPSHIHFPNFVIRKGSMDHFNKIISETAVVAKKSEVLDLPPFMKLTREVDLGLEQKRAYDEMYEDFITYINDEACVAQLAITKGIKLMQIVSGFLQVNENVTHRFRKNPRLEMLEELLTSLTPNHKVIVWATFRENYKSIAELCSGNKIGFASLTGDTNAKQKFEMMDKFNNTDECRVMIANQQAGGVGINLIASDTSIYYSRNFKWGDDEQSEGRNYRGGSEIHKCVTRIDLIARNTIDEVVLNALSAKESTGEALLRRIKDAVPRDY